MNAISFDDYETMKAERDELEAQLNARIEEIRDVVDERDEARAIARKMATLAVAYAPDHGSQCIFCDAFARYSLKLNAYEAIKHQSDCPVRIIAGWDGQENG